MVDWHHYLTRWGWDKNYSASIVLENVSETEVAAET
jgi:hypothetical protein